MTEQQFLEAVSDSRGVHPAKLIRLALEDLRKVEADPKYRVDMGEWHYSYRQDSPCCVCFAGSVMAKTMDVPVDTSAAPSDFKTMAVRRAMLALNELRLGAVCDAYSSLRRECPRSIPEDLEVSEYCSSVPAEFHASMQGLADLIEQHDPIA